jgi:FAD-dependent oxidoreductase domain-containing protein 1
MEKRMVDVVIVGGGIMGCAIAYHLLKFEPGLAVAVVEMDPTYTQASTTLSMSNVRIQFSLKQNIEVSRYALQVLTGFEDEMTVDDRRPNISFKREGNLFMVDAAGRPEAEAALALQQTLDCRVEWWSADRVRRRFPLFETAGLEGGTFGREDGHLDAYALLMAYRAKARSLGAVYLHDEVSAIRTHNRRVCGVGLRSGSDIRSGCVVNSAGAWAAGVARSAGVDLPVKPVKRQVYALDTAVKPESPLPLTVLPSGLYFRSETGGLVLLGKSMPDDPEGFDFNWDDRRFTDILWPELAAFVPAFDTLKLVRGWAGLYAVNTMDGNAILGEWPEVAGLYLANGFSGHGLQQGPAVGRYVAELITGRTPVLDLSVFSPRRILEKRPISESGLV